MPFRSSTFIGLLGGLLLSLAAYAADIEQTFPFANVAMPELMMGAGTQAPAMGGAGAALTQDLDSLYWNPAGLSRVAHMRLEFGHTSWIEDVNHEFLAFGMPLADGVGAVGLNYIALGSIDKTGITSDGRIILGGGTLNLSLLNLCGGYSFATAEGISFGGTVKLILESLGEASPFAVAVDAGLQYPVPQSNFVLGAMLANLGSPIAGHSLPMTLRVGGGYLAELLHNQKLNAAADVELPVLAPGQGFLRLGLEYVLDNTLFLRTGYALAEDASLGATGGLSAGVGVIVNGWRLGYAFVPQGGWGASHQLSISLDFQEIPAAGRRPDKTENAEPGSEALLKVPGGQSAPSLPSLSESEKTMRTLLKTSFNIEVELGKNAGPSRPQDVLLRVKRAAGPRIIQWKLAFSNGSGQSVADISGEGMPGEIRWDGLDKAGQPVRDVPLLRYTLVLTDVNHAEERAEGLLVPPVRNRVEAESENEKIPDRRLEPVLFSLKRAEITPQAVKTVAEAVKWIQKYPRMKILIEGFCDPADEMADALILSKARAEAVSRYLTAYHKVSMTRILIRVRGEANPVVSGGTAEERRRNRRVEITLINSN